MGNTLICGHAKGLDRHPCGQIQALKIQNTAEGNPTGVDQQWKPISLRNCDFGFDILCKFTDTQLQFGNQRTHFDTVMERIPTPSQMIPNFEEIFPVGRYCKSNETVRAPIVVVAGNGATLRVVENQHGIQFRSQSTSPDVDFECLPLLGGEAKIVNVGFGTEDSVERDRCRGFRCLCDRFVRLLLDRIVQVSQPKAVT